MEQGTYNNLAVKGLKKKIQVNLAIPSSESGPSLEQIIEHQIYTRPDFTREMLLQAYLSRLHSIRKMDKLEKVIETLFSLQHQMEQIPVEFQIGDWPNINEIYIQLSPILLRSVDDFVRTSAGPEEIKKSWLESIRVVLEEEIYQWQEGQQVKGLS